MRPDGLSRIIGVMAYPRKTEHSGPKRGRGAYWGPKREAKRKSSRKRRENWRREIREAR
jgi:hypothetical protein